MLPRADEDGTSFPRPGLRSALDDVVNLDQLGLARIYPDVGEEGHEARPEGLELFPRVPDLADFQVPVRAEAHVVVETVGWEVPGRLKPPDAFVVLLRGQRRGGEADQ